MCVCGMAAWSAGTGHAAVAPYTPDASTLHLYHFDETGGAADPGNPIADQVTVNPLDLPNTGGPNGRNNATAGGYGAAAATGFGTSFDVLLSGNTSFSTGANASSGGVRSAAAVPQSTLQSATGAFTYEALIFVNNLDAGAAAGTQTILSHDGNMAGNSSGNTDRGFQFRLLDSADAGNAVDQLSLYVGISSPASISHNFSLPTAGPNALATGAWFHTAVTYTGEEGVANNLSFYWTRLDPSVGTANLLGTATLAADLAASADVNWFGIGALTRGEFSRQLRGLIDEVRISDTARDPGQFLFAAPPSDVPEPAAPASLALTTVLLRRKRP